MTDQYDQKLANIDKAEALFRQAGLKVWAWTPEVRQAVLRGEMPSRLEEPGDPVIEGARPLSPYLEFNVLRRQVAEARGRAQTSPAAEQAAQQRMAEVLAEAAALVEQLLPLAEEATRLHHTVARCKLARVTAGTPVPDENGVPQPNVVGEANMRPREQITAADLVGFVLDPSRDPFELEHHRPQGLRVFAAGLGTGEPKEPRVTVREVREEHARQQQRQRTGS